MIYNAYRVLIFFCLLLPFIFCLSSYGSPTPPGSAMRIQKISKAISKYKESGENLNDNDVVSAILKDVSELYQLEPEAKKNAKSPQEMKKTVTDKVAQKFPPDENIKKKAETEAGKIFTMSNILDYVTVKYLKGEKTFDAEGIFFGYGSTGNSINVGGNVIAIYDIVPEDRVKFDEAYRNQKRDSFVQTKVRDYYSRRNAYSFQVADEVTDAVNKENEDNGYIYYMNAWRNPKEVALSLIKDMPSPAAPLSDKSTPPKTAGTSAILSVPGTAASDDPKTQAPAKEDPAIAKKREEIKKLAEEKRLENTTRNAGIDADQGFELAYWGIRKDEFALLYPQYSTSLATGDIETINYDTGPISRMEIHFISDFMYKVVYVFRVGPAEAMLALGRKLKDKYGLTDQEKLDAVDPAKANRKDPCDSSHEFHNGICTKCGWTEAEVGMPLEQVYAWTGKETKGQLTIRLNNEKTAYTDFMLSRESPKFKKLSDDIAIGVEQKKKREVEEQKKKTLEEYNKFK